jgi:hypothetical protein
MTKLKADSIPLFEASRDKQDKATMKKLQVVYMEHNPEHKANCMCKKTSRKILHRAFYDWYDKERN